MTKNSSLRPEVDVDHILTFFAVTYSLESHSNLKRFTNPIRQPEDDINQFVACSEKFARSLANAIFPGIICRVIIR